MKEFINFSSRKRRIAAFFIDFFVLNSILIIAFFLFFGNDLMKEGSPEIIHKKISFVTISGLILFVIKDSFHGISLGRWLFSIMVRDRKNTNIAPSFFRLIIRNLLLVIWPIELLVSISNKDKRRLGDKLSQSVVIKNDKKHNKLLTILISCFLVTLFFVISSFIFGNLIKSSEAYKIAIKDIETNQEIINSTGNIEGFGLLPMGSISMSNNIGKAVLEIKVLGKLKNRTVTVYMYKPNNEPWKVIKLELEPE